MTSRETAETMLEKVKNTMGLVFIEGDDWVWVFKNGSFLMAGHSISAKQLLRELKMPYTSFSFEDNDAADEFSNLI